jgi:hypothetical protein
MGFADYRAKGSPGQIKPGRRTEMPSVAIDFAPGPQYLVGILERDTLIGAL